MKRMWLLVVLLPLFGQTARWRSAEVTIDQSKYLVRWSPRLCSRDEQIHPPGCDVSLKPGDASAVLELEGVAQQGTGWQTIKRMGGIAFTCAETPEKFARLEVDYCGHENPEKLARKILATYWDGIGVRQSWMWTREYLEKFCQEQRQVNGHSECVIPSDVVVK